jgi:outer membrane receptor protein involved in Fe transport
VLAYEPFAKVAVGTSYNDRAHDDYISYDTPGDDWRWANGSNDRMTDVFDADNEYQPLAAFPDSRIPADVDMIAQRENVPLGYSMAATAGGGFEVLKRKIKLMGMLSYDSSFKTADGYYQSRWPYAHVENNSYVADLWYGELTAHGPLYDYTQSTAEVNLTALAAMQIDLDEDAQHTVTFIALGTQVGGDTVTKLENGEFVIERPDLDDGSGEGINEWPLDGFAKRRFYDDSTNVTDSFYWDLLTYEERNLASYQVLGDHSFDLVGSSPLEASWALSHSTTYSSEPDFRSMEYFYDPDTQQFGTSNRRDDIANQYRSWREIDESQDFARADFDQTFLLGTSLSLALSTGYYYENAERTAIQGRTQFAITNRSDDPERLAGENANYIFFPSSRNVNIEASRRVDAGYLSGVLTLFSQLDFILGARIESVEMGSHILSDIFGQRYIEGLFTGDDGMAPLFDMEPGEDGEWLEGGIDRVFLLPNVGMAYRPIDGLALRLNYSETAARPSFRESMAYMAFDPDKLDNTFGNPQLDSSDVRSADFRAEYIWGSLGDLAAISLFYKEVDRPIEQVYMNSNLFGSYYSWINNENTAYLNGVELEVRKHLDFLGEGWKT